MTFNINNIERALSESNTGISLRAIEKLEEIKEIRNLIGIDNTIDTGSFAGMVVKAAITGKLSWRKACNLVTSIDYILYACSKA